MIDHLMPDIPRLYSAIAEWLACMIFILPFKKRFSKIKTGVIMAVMLVVQSGFMVVTEDVSLFFWIPCMMVAVFLMLFFIYVSCAIEITDAVYFVLIAFVVAEFMASIEWQVACYFRIAQSGVWWREWLALILGYGIISVILFKILYVHFPEDGQIEIGWKECLSAFLIAISVFAVSNISYLTINTPFSGRYSFEIANIRTIVDLAGIAILYAHLMQCCEMRARKELEAVQNVLQNQYAQYVQSKESIELINYKYHDLKHQIAVLRSEEDPQKREAFLDEMEAEIRQYEAQNKTGNNVLDVMLTLKTLYCQKHGVTMTSVIDGTLFDFMNAMDISSIFGNALDNAIECELKIPDKEKRLIHINAHARKNFLIILFDNYYEGDMKLGNGLPETTKKDAQFHGYGLKSVQYTAQKYGGAVDVSANDHWFHLKILIPMPAQTETAKAGSDGAAETVNTVAATAATETTKAAANTAREKNNNTAI